MSRRVAKAYQGPLDILCALVVALSVQSQPPVPSQYRTVPYWEDTGGWLCTESATTLSVQ